MTKTQKEVLANIERDGGSFAASDWAYTREMGAFTYPKWNRRVDAVLELAEMGLIKNHNFSTYHSLKETCFECDFEKAVGA